MFVIRHSDSKRYVARPGGLHSFTKDLKEAQKFVSKEEAEKNKCSDETVIDLERLFDEYRD